MNHKEMIEGSIGTLAQLYWQREEIEREMGKLHLAIRGLLNLVEDKAEREGYKALLDNYRVRTGLTDLVLLSLRTADKPLTPTEIRNFIRDYGSEASEQQNLLQSVHTTLKRMENQVKEVTNEDDEKAYRIMNIGERLVRAALGIDPANANRVGQRMQTLAEVRAIAPRTRPRVWKSLEDQKKSGWKSLEQQRAEKKEK